MKKSLPPRPSLEQLRKQAKELLRSLESGDPAAQRRFESAHLKSAGGEGATRSLADAQHVIAREHGFKNWAELGRHVRARGDDAAAVGARLHEAFAADDARTVREILEAHPAIAARINEPVGPFDAPAITQVRSREMLDVLLQAGADINARSRWWAGGFGLLDQASPELAAYAITRGARVDVHAAARLGLIGSLREFVARQPDLVHARGGDGQTPLHCAGTVEVADFLLDHGADIDARDVDHESTPAQYMLRDRLEIARRLVERGCHTDILMAAALGDVNLVRRHLEADPACVRMRVSDEYFPRINVHAGGTIYQWTLGSQVSACDIARERGHDEILRLLVERSPAEVNLIDACWAGDEPAVSALLARHPGLVATLSAADRRQVAHAARNNHTAAVRAMLRAGLPVDARGQHDATPLHWAAWHGNVEMTREILSHRPPMEARDRDFAGTPLRWAIHGSEHGWHAQTGDYPAVVRLLFEAGSDPSCVSLDGTEAVRVILREHGVRA